MKIFLANLEEVFREASARWTLIAYFILSTLFILLFASVVNLDVVDGALAGARLFGEEIQMGHGDKKVKITEVVSGLQSVIAGMMYLFGVLLALFATAHLVPRMMEKGTVDLYLSRPVGRIQLLLSRYVAGLILVGLNLAYLFGAMWVMIIIKTGVVNPRLWLGALVIYFTAAVLMAFAFLIGVITSSTTVSLMGSFAVYVFGAILMGHKQIAAALSSGWAAGLVDGLYWILPKTGELSQATVGFVAGSQVMDKLDGLPSRLPEVFFTTAIFGLVSLALAAGLFKRRDF